MDNITIKCKCGKNFISPRWAHRKYCSRQCFVKYRKTHKALFKKGFTPWNKGKTGLQVSYRKGKTWNSIWGGSKASEMKRNLRNKKYKGSLGIDNDGYKRSKDNKTGKEFLVHQQVWKKNNLPIIPKGFCVHHIDGDKLNNNPRNLMLLDIGMHSSLHNKARGMMNRRRRKL